MEPINIAFLDRSTISPEVSLRAPDFPHRWAEYPQTLSHSETLERLEGVEIAVTNKVPLISETLMRLPRLKMIAVAATGTNVVDIDSCRQLGISVSNVKGYASTTVSEHCMASLLALRRNLFQYRQEVADGVWQQAGQFCYFNRPIHDLAGSTMGLVGTGAIARSLAELAIGFGMNVVYHSPGGREDVDGRSTLALTALLREADVVSLHCPLTEATHGLIGLTQLQLMKPNAILINTARGEVIDPHALKTAMEQNMIGGAALDVAPVEPPSADSPLMQLVHYPNFLLTPHIGWASVGAMQVLSDQLIDNIEAFVRGESQNLVT